MVDAESLTALLVVLWLQADPSHRISNLLGDLWTARCFVLELIALCRKASIVVVELVLLAV